MENIRILDRIVPGYTEKFLSGRYGLEEMPLLQAVGDRFRRKLASSHREDTYIIACQHLLQPQLEMFKLFISLGIPASHITILPKVYSANPAIVAELKALGCRVVEAALEFKVQESFDAFHRQQCADLVRYAFTHIPETGKLIILDDGGMLLQQFAQSKDLFYFKKGIYGVEQTASGKNILLKKRLPFAVTSVASSVEKIEIETNYIIRHSMYRMMEYFAEERIASSAKILVLGKGPIGRTMINSLREKGYACDGYDITDGKMRYQLGDYDVIIGATGSNSVSVCQLGQLKNGCHLVSISSSDREFPATEIRNNSLSGSKPHDTFVYMKNDIHLANGGFPITFKGERIECFPIEMDVTKMKLAEGVFSHCIGQSSYEESINDLYIVRKLPRFKSLLYGAWVFLSVLAIAKIWWLGFTVLPPDWFKGFMLTGLLLSSYPALWLIQYHKRIEKYF